MRVNEINLSGVTADPNGIATSQTPAGGGVQALTLTGTQPPEPMLVDITMAADETGRVFTITGTDRHGNSISDTVGGVAIGVGQSLKQFATVVSITVDDDTAGAVEVGWAAILFSAWFPLNTYPMQIETQVAVTVTGTVDYDMELAFENPQGRAQNTSKYETVVYGDIEAALTPVTDADIDGDTTSTDTVLTKRATCLRFKMNSGTGSIVARIQQAGSR